MLRQLVEDARFYAGGYPHAKVAAWRILWTCLTDRGYWFLLGYRVTHFATYSRDLRNPAWWIARVLESILHYINVLASKSEVLADCFMPGTVRFSPGGHYLLGAKGIGPGTVLQPHVTFGMSVSNGGIERPTVGANVWIGRDCVIAGKLHLGDGSTVLPGSYVTIDVPPGAVVKGNPARIVRTAFDNTEGRRLVQQVAVPPGLEP
ncbi:MAG: hypothetical protein M3Y79_01130 [Pseudomonadota bacterium]|nr:hypothetical protein [Pseudomonadota bacterium]